MNPQQSSTGATIVTNSANEGVIKMRLDTGKLLNDVEMFLKGIRLVPKINKEGQTELVVNQRGEELVSDEGIQCILMTLNQTISSHGVQGNWKPDYFEQFVHEADVNFSCDLWVNMRKWRIKLENYNVICNAFMNLIQQFTSRIIENKERESYGLSMKTSESTVLSPSRVGSLFGSGG